MNFAALQFAIKEYAPAYVLNFGPYIIMSVLSYWIYTVDSDKSQSILLF